MRDKRQPESPPFVPLNQSSASACYESELFYCSPAACLLRCPDPLLFRSGSDRSGRVMSEAAAQYFSQ